MTRAVGQQIEHLEDDAEVLGAEIVARRGGQPGDVGAEDPDLPPAGARCRTAGRNVDLPLPDGPISKRRSRRARAKLAIENANGLRPGQANRTFENSTIAVAGAPNPREAPLTGKSKLK